MSLSRALVEIGKGEDWLEALMERDPDFVGPYLGRGGEPQVRRIVPVGVNKPAVKHTSALLMELHCYTSGEDAMSMDEALAKMGLDASFMETLDADERDFLGLDDPEVPKFQRKVRLTPEGIRRDMSNAKEGEKIDAVRALLDAGEGRIGIVDALHQLNLPDAYVHNLSAEACEFIANGKIHVLDLKITLFDAKHTVMDFRDYINKLKLKEKAAEAQEGYHMSPHVHR